MNSNPLNPNAINGAIARAASQRNTEVSQINSVTGKIFIAGGFIEVINAGELLIDIVFPVRFLEVPFITGTGHLAEGEVVVAGQLPKIHVCAVSFVNTGDPLKEINYYTGATLSIVCEGHPTMHSFANWIAIGRALVGPMALPFDPSEPV